MLAQFQQKNLARNEITIVAAMCSKNGCSRSIGICNGIESIGTDGVRILECEEGYFQA
jgi:hypothetical protein